jgi:hypothetical protein
MELFMGNQNFQEEGEFNDGLILLVHNQTSLPFFNSERILVPSGAENDIKIVRSFIEKLGGVYSLCVHEEDEFSSEFFDYIVKTLKITYSQEYCLNLCIQKQVILKCGCASVFLPEYNNYRFCSFSDLDCSYNITVSILNGNNNITDCDSMCPLECDYIEYNIQLSGATYPTQYYANLYSKNSKIISSGISNDDLSKSLIKLNIFYGTTTYTYIGEAAALDAETLFSTIGGFLGLCIGTSILFVIEVLELCFRIIGILTTNTYQPRIRNNKRN